MIKVVGSIRVKTSTINQNPVRNGFYIKQNRNPRLYRKNSR